MPITLTVPRKAKPPWRQLYAFGLPNGSVRAMLALIVCGAIWVWLWKRPDQLVPDYLQNLMFIILGHYFASRAKGDDPKSAAEAGPPPLFLPTGTIRWLLVIGFASVAVSLYRHDRLLAIANPQNAHPNPAAVTLILVAGFLAGVLLSKFHDRVIASGRTYPRIFEDIRATVALLAAVSMVLLIFGMWALPDTGVSDSIQRFLLKYRAEDVLAAVVGFYFGSRS